MSAGSDSGLSLIERKKLQWAKEKEELAALGATWGVTENNCKAFERNPRESKRRSSLPPLYKNQYNSYDREKEIGGETSGYGSDNPNQSPDYMQNWHQSGYESSSSRDDRLKWGDKGVGVGKFWQPKEETTINEPPNWVKRGLKNGEIIVNNTSPAESPEQRYEEERPQTGSSYSQNRSTFLRGQNIPIDSIELAERERRRQAALAHQEAIRQQLEEREKRKQEEKERRIKEEYEEELRIEREQEIERKRQQQELEALKIRQERERKRKETIEEAIELAQKEAVLEKQRKNKNNLNQQKNLDLKSMELKVEIPEPLNNTRKVPSRAESLNNDLTTNNLEIKGKTISSPQLLVKEETPTPKKVEKTNPEPTSCPNIQLDNNNIALIFPSTQLENIQNIHYALFIPTITPRTENRVLTPTQFRQLPKQFCDSSTQTDTPIYHQRESSFETQEKSAREYEPRIRKERRSRSESLEDRPKWGANRPPTRYIKQSEKDPLYQRRKLRQKQRQTKTYDDSDDSPTGSPRNYRKKGCKDRRNIRIYQSEIIPLESDKDYIYYKQECTCLCRCRRHRCSERVGKVDILKIDSPRTIYDTIEQQLPELSIKNDMIDKLSCLHNNLLIKQHDWDNLPTTTTPPPTASWQ